MPVKSSETVEVTVARGHTLVAGEPHPVLGTGQEFTAGQRVQVPVSDIPRLLKLGVIVRPQTQEQPGFAAPPPIEGQPKIARADADKA